MTCLGTFYNCKERSRRKLSCKHQKFNSIQMENYRSTVREPNHRLLLSRVRHSIFKYNATLHNILSVICFRYAAPKTWLDNFATDRSCRKVVVVNQFILRICQPNGKRKKYLSPAFNVNQFCMSHF